MFILAISPGHGFDRALWARVLASGVNGLMVREPALPAAALLEAARWARAEAPEVEVWVNGRLDVALAAGCGLHAPEAHPDVTPDLLPLSRPIHAEAQVLPRAGARQLILSPIFPVPGKGPAWGVARLHRALDALPADPPRALALGGVTPENAASLRHPGLAGVALIRGLWASGSPRAAVEGLRRAWEAEKGTS